MWKLFGSIDGLNRWLVQEEGCWIANLVEKFGQSRNCCNMCDRCKGTPVQIAAAANTSVVRANNKRKNVAMNVLRRMEMECIICGCDSCDGEKCLPRGACFRCGGSHLRSLCTTNWESILCNKGCFYCLDLYFHQGFRSHAAKSNSCPLQRRLKRLVIHCFSKSAEQDIGRFYSRIASERSSFYSFLAAAATTLPTQTVTVFDAVQVNDDDDAAPLLAPDHYCAPELQHGQPVSFSNASDSRNIYRYLKTQPNSSRRLRDFVYGALYKNLIGTDVAYIDCSGANGRRVELNVEIQEGGVTDYSEITISNESECNEMLDSIVCLGCSLGTSGNARRNVGDLGDMWGLGYRNKKTCERYKISEQHEVQEKMYKVCKNVVRDLGDKVPETFESIRKAEELDANCPPLSEMCGRSGPKED